MDYEYNELEIIAEALQMFGEKCAAMPLSERRYEVDAIESVATKVIDDQSSKAPQDEEE